MFLSQDNRPADSPNWADCLNEVRESLVDRTVQLARANQELANQIAERKRVEEALRQTEEKYRSIFENAVEGIFQTTLEGQYISANPALAQIYGYQSPEELIQSISDISRQLYVNPNRRQEFIELISKQNSITKFESQVYKADGSIIWISENARVVKDPNGKPLYYEGIIEDITERKQADEALRLSESQLREKTHQLEQTLIQLQRTQSQLVQTEKMSSLGQLVAGVAHEINNPVSFVCGNLAHASRYTQDLLYLINLYQQHYPNPITAIQDFAEEVDLEFLKEDLPKTLDSMHIGADRIRQIVLSLRNFSRHDEAQMKPVDIHEGIDSTLLILANRLKARAGYPEIKIIKDYGDLPLVECYAGQLNQVFMNLLGNAVDALEETPQKWNRDSVPQIKIQTKMSHSDRIIIKIADNGPGMSPEVSARLFSPFFTTKPIGKGTGLGLSISQQIVVEKHGGELTCDSEAGRGTEFAIALPIKAIVK